MLRAIGNQFRQPKGLLRKVTSFLMRKDNGIFYDKFLDKLEIKNNEKIFEIGYGHGIGIEKILSANDCFISGIDFSELMFKQALKNNKKYVQNGKIELYYGDFLEYIINFKMTGEYITSSNSRSR